MVMESHGRMFFAVLGPVALVDGAGGRVTLNSACERTLLASLLLRVNEPVSCDTLIDELWDGRAEAGNARALRTHVGRLRDRIEAILGPQMAKRIETCPAGYLIRLGEPELDATRLTALSRDALEARSERRWSDACASAQQAELLWQGEPLFGVESETLREACRPQLARLELLRFQALEVRIDAELRLGRHEQLVPELAGLTRQHPDNERFWAQRVQALIQCGRLAEASTVVRKAFAAVEREHNVPPGRELRDLRDRIAAERARLSRPDAAVGTQQAARYDGPPSPVNRADRPATHERVGVVRRTARQWRLIVPVAAVALAAALGQSSELASHRTPLTGGAAGPVALTPGADPLTVQAAFGWLPANASHAGYSLHDSQLTAIARGGGSITSGQYPATIVLSAFPPGTMPPSSLAGDSNPVRIAAPDVNGHTAYWLSAAADDPTNSGDTFLYWQTADGRWLELHGYYLASDDITGELHRVATSVTVTSKAIPLPIQLHGLPKTAMANEVDLNRPAPDGSTDWRLDLIIAVGGAYIDFSAAPADKMATSHDPACVSDSGLIGCVSVTGQLPPSLAAGGLPGLLGKMTLLGLGESRWTTHVIS